MNISIEQLDKVLNNSPFLPYKLVDLLAKQYPNTYNNDVGVWEKYTLRRHTLMVMHQFEKYFAHLPLPGKINTKYFRLYLALHDLGKPKALANGNKNLQHQFTVPLIEELFNKLYIDSIHTKLAIVLASGDPIGKYIRSKKNVEETKDIIHAKAKESTLAVTDFFKLQIIAYKVDAGSYTEDAGGNYSLDKLFDFDIENKTLNFAEHIQSRIDLLGF